MVVNGDNELSSPTHLKQQETLTMCTDNKNINEENGINKDVTDGKNVKTASFQRLITRIKTDKNYRQRLIHTAILYWSFVGLGWSAAMNGPTFPDLRHIIGEDLATSAWMFTVGSFGYLSGSLIGGILYDKLNKVLLLALCSLVSSMATLLTPYCSTLPWMLFIRYIGGVFFGGLDTGGNADIIHVWGRDVDPYMQALHFAFSLGALLSPLATEPFLAGKTTVCLEETLTPINSSSIPTTTAVMNYTSIVLDPNTSTNAISNSSYATKCTEQVEDTRVYHAFLIASLFMITSAVGYAYLYIMLKRNKQNAAISDVDVDSNSTNINDRRKVMSIYVKVVILVLLSLFMALYCVAEDAFAGFLMTFSIEYLEWDKKRGSFATAVFWFSFGIGRFAGIFIVSFCKNSSLLTSYLLILSLSYTGLLLSTLFKYYPLIWVFICTIGFSLSVIFPAVFSWTSEHIIHVSGKISSLFLTSSCVSGMVFPLLIGNLMEHFHPMWYVYILVIVVFTCLLLYSIIRIIDKCCLTKPPTESHAIGDEALEETEMTLMGN